MEHNQCHEAPFNDTAACTASCSWTFDSDVSLSYPLNEITEWLDSSTDYMLLPPCNLHPSFPVDAPSGLSSLPRATSCSSISQLLKALPASKLRRGPISVPPQRFNEVPSEGKRHFAVGTLATSVAWSTFAL